VTFHNGDQIELKDITKNTELKCCNFNIGFATKCEVQRPMRAKMCLGVKHTLTSGVECKG
jgi:hypothetical protein